LLHAYHTCHLLHVSYHDRHNKPFPRHGFLGYDRFGPFVYFEGVADHLKGNHVITPKVSMVDGIEDRAKQLDKEIRAKLPDLALPQNVMPKVHLIGLSTAAICSYIFLIFGGIRSQHGWARCQTSRVRARRSY
jgi:hypothetical protein